MFSSQAAGCVITVGLSLAVTGCGQVGLLKAKMAFRDANGLYQRQDYKAAAAKYEETVTECKGSAAQCDDPDLSSAYFFLGNSYDNQYRPARRGEAENDALMNKAIDNYKTASQVANSQYKKLSLQYLVNAYGADKLNDPAQQEPLLQQMIEMDPTDPGNYSVLANVYEQNGDYERAEQLLVKAREVKPSDPAVYTTLAAFYERQGDFPKMIEAYQARINQEPNNPEAHYTIATEYWEKAYRDVTTSEAEKVKFVQAGLQAVDKAIELKPDYFEALTYKNLLLRVQATLEKNPARQQALLKEANEFRAKAQEIQAKQRAAGAGE